MLMEDCVMEEAVEEVMEVMEVIMVEEVADTGLLLKEVMEPDGLGFMAQGIIYTEAEVAGIMEKAEIA